VGAAAKTKKKTAGPAAILVPLLTLASTSQKIVVFHEQLGHRVPPLKINTIPNAQKAYL
jgi:hypothetical protein